MSNNQDFPYVHGFSEHEQDRLKQQASFTEQSIYRDVDFSNIDKLLEVGVGVGGQTEILLRRFPKLHLTGIELNNTQLQTAKKNLSALSYAKNRFDLHQMDASNMQFKANEFDGAFVCWVLEHTRSPEQIINEIRRVLRPGSQVIVNEVMNHTFFLDPYSPNLWKYWMAFNDFQYEQAGDPFVGAKLGNVLISSGLSNVKTKVINWHFDKRHPSRRKEVIAFWRDLTMSAAETLISANKIDQATVEATKKEYDIVANDPQAVFYFSFMQASGIV